MKKKSKSCETEILISIITLIVYLIRSLVKLFYLCVLCYVVILFMRFMLSRYFVYAFYACRLCFETTVSKTKPKYQFRRGVKMVKENFTLVSNSVLFYVLFEVWILRGFY